ncbi:ArsR/SmtB family transcription factor [Actinomadura monticuli]|uniref:Helix-turn-helix domain-containing protein n=1 Tax=Actinomadura monticuli TaxID=3097367 RepID=A0ABV4Q3V3_9ACTN
MIRIDLGPDGLARTRFAISPVRAANELLFMLWHHPHLLGRQWQRRAGEALRVHRLELLAAVSGRGPYCYSPDFVSPVPEAYERTPEAELHRVAVTSMERVGREMGNALDRSGDVGTSRTLVRNALDRGERHFAELLAGQLEQFWTAALAPHWPHIRARLEDDVAHRADAIARDGFAQMIEGLGPTVRWREGGLDIDRLHRRRISAEAAVFTPTVFLHHTMYDVHKDDLAPQTPLISYPAISTASVPPRPLDELVGATRAWLLAELATPRSTTELAERLHLTPGTVSYHLQVLHRAGLVHRTRRSRHVLYQRVHRARGATVQE